MIRTRQPFAKILVYLLIANCFIGCSLISDTPPYDIDTYKQATAINTKVHTFFIKVAGSDDEHKKYKYHKATYEEILVDLMTFLTRAEIRADTDLIDAVKKCIVFWRQSILAHKEGVESPTLKALARTLRNDGIEKAYEQSKSVHTAATQKQMGAIYSPAERDLDFEGFLQQLRMIIKIEVSRKAQ